MGAFNILNVETCCPNCGKKYTARIQFKFGETWQLEYNIGDKIIWGLNNKGIQGLDKVYVYGSLENDKCSYCGLSGLQTRYDIVIIKDVIIGVRPMQDDTIYYEVEDQNYAVAND
jgi:hypothetical protein